MEKKIIIYQTLPRLFGNKNKTCALNGTLETNGVGKFDDITPKALNEIRLLGCTHIWYTGVIEHATQTDYTTYGIRLDNPYIVKGKAGSPYAIKDYYDVDPDLANDVDHRMEEFEALIQRTHDAGLKVVTDFVPNHVARQYHSDRRPEGVDDLGTNDDTNLHFSPQNNYYYIPRQTFSGQFFLGEGEQAYTEYPAKATGNDCFGAYPNHNDWYETVKLNYGVDYTRGRQKHFDPIPDTWHKMLDILLFWASKGVDAFRCDMAEMVPVEFWGWVIHQVKKTYPDILFIAEVYNPHEYRFYIFNGKFDYLYDKVGLYDLLRSITEGHASATQITRCWQSLDGIIDHMLNFLENHDEQRIASDYFAQDPFRAIPALVVSVMMNKNPFMLYFGQELGESGMDNEGFSGRDGRTSIFDYWSITSVRNWVNDSKFNEALLTPSQKELRKIYKKILRLANQETAIREGLFFDLMYVNSDHPGFNPNRQYTFLRKCKNELLIIAVNFDGYTIDTSINIPTHAFDILEITPGLYDATELLGGSEKSVKLSAETPFKTELLPYGATVWKIKLVEQQIKKQKKSNLSLEKPD